MPIINMTDRGMAFPEIGQIRKGAPKKEGANRPGIDLTYFRVEFDEQETEARVKFEEHFGEEPKEILIWLPYDEMDRCWDAWLEAYTASQLVAKSDGEKFIFLRDVETGEVLVRGGIELATGLPMPYTDGQVVGHYTTSKSKKKKGIFCSPVGRLKVIIPALERFCYLTLHTTSYHDIVNISSQLEALMFINNGGLQHIDIVLKRKPKAVSVPMPDGKRKRMTKYLISLEAAPEWVQKQVNGYKQRAELQQLPETVIDEDVRLIDEGDEQTIDAEIKEETPETALPHDNQSYWDYVYDVLGFSKNKKEDTELARQVLADCNVDYAVAAQKLKEQHVPPENYQE